MIARLAFVLALILSATAFAQVPSSSLGVGSGSTAVDPSKNVLDALLAAVTRLNDISAIQHKREDDLRAAGDALQNQLRDAETRRVNELASQKQVFDLELARGIRANVDASALLLAGQVKELKTDTSDRIAKLEVFANEQRGIGTGRTDMYGWILGGFGFLLLLLGTAVAIIVAVRVGHSGVAHEREDAERYRQYIDRRIADFPASNNGSGAT